MSQPGFEPILAHILPAERLVFASPIVCAGLFRCAPDDPHFAGGAPCSSHCIVFPREAAWIQHEGARRFLADASMATMYNQGQVYYRWSIDNRPDRCDWLAFPGSIIRQAVQSWSVDDAGHERHPLRFGAAPIAAGLYAAQRRFFTSLERRIASDTLAIEETALWLLDEVVASAYSSRRVRTDAPRRSQRAADAVEIARLTLARDPAARIPLASLGSLAGVSPFHLCREFRRHTGTTISAYRIGLRLRASLEPVAAGQDLTTIALGLGFTSHSHFTHAFRRAFGAVPSTARGKSRPERFGRS